LALAIPWTIWSLWINTTIVIDAEKPTCTFDYNPTSWTVVNTDVIATCTPSEPVTYQQPLWTGVYTFTENGSYEFQFTDNAWNTWSSTATVYWIDKTAPVLTQVTAVPTPTNNTTPSYTFSSTETGTITYSCYIKGSKFPLECIFLGKNLKLR
jgi:hypothetical protein